MASPYFQTLPAELLYRIADYLDVRTLLLSFRYVCTRFRSIVDQSHRCELHLSSGLARNDFDRLCSWINPETLLSITLVNNEETPGQILLFFSRFCLEQFIRLRSLTLINIDGRDCQKILRCTRTKSLKTFSLQLQGKRNREILEFLSDFICRSDLQSLTFNTFAHSVDEIFLCVQSELQYLTIGICTYEEYQTILRSCPQLRTLVLEDCWITEESIFSISCSSPLISLTIKETNRSISQLHHLLALTPLLRSLHLINSSATCHCLIDGGKWEGFLREKLTQLNQFDFLFYQRSLKTFTSHAEIDSILAPFRTAFWLDEKQWFVTCDYIKQIHQTRFYSIPYPISTFEYHLHSENISISTLIKTDLQSSLMDRVQNLSLDFMQIQMKGISYVRRQCSASVLNIVVLL